MTEKLYSPDGTSSIKAHISQVEYLLEKGWTKEGKTSKSVSKKQTKNEE